MSGRWVSLRPSSRARDEKGFREWPSHIDRDARSQMRDPLYTPIGGRCSCLHCLKASRTTSPLASILASSRIWSAPLPLELAPSSAWPGPCRVFSLLKTRRPPCASPVGRGSSGSAVGAGRFYADTEGFRLASPPPGPLRAKAAMTNTGSLAGTRALHIEHVFAAIGALSQAAFRVAAHGAVDADPVGSRERRWTRGLR